MEETKPKYYAIIPAYVRYDNELNADEAIKHLSLYKKSSGREYKDDYATIKLWVMDNVMKNENNYTRKQKKLSLIDWEKYYDVGI